MNQDWGIAALLPYVAVASNHHAQALHSLGKHLLNTVSASGTVVGTKCQQRIKDPPTSNFFLFFWSLHSNSKDINKERNIYIYIKQVM